MHERICDQLYRRRHMRPVPYSTTVTGDFSPNPTNIATSDSFSKDGREIHVGDCALFKPPQDSPPFIGIILKLIVGNEEDLRLGVNWLYRPTDVKLAKGNSPLQAAPNEVFYSFHKDETPVASLLHPCKVAFLRRGVELPPRTFSFVCRRVYDIENKCLWWLTDKDYLNERQEEVNYLLDRTKQAMHGGGRSPRTFNGTVITQQLNQSADNNNNNNNSSSNSIPPEAKSKRRERIPEQGSDPMKRERFSKSDIVDSSTLRRTESMLKAEIAKITGKGGLVDLDSADRLVNLIKPDYTDCTEKTIDLVRKLMIVNVIASTDRFDCLARFVQLKGLPVLDEWLQEIHKGKNGGGNSPKENERNVEDFLLALLCALDKLPVNLDALQTCNIGKSVNHLRTHKNSEIQRKARTLVDTWKKRVEAEMNMIDAKSASSSRGVTWPSKSMNSESSNKRLVGGCENVAKVPSVQQSVISRSPSIKHHHSSMEVMNNNNNNNRLSSASPSSVKSPHPSTVTCNSREQTGRGVQCGEEKSSNSSQSQNNSHSCSSDQVKASREDARSSTAISASSNRIISGGVSSRPRKSSNTLCASSCTGTAHLKENSFLSNHSSSSHRNTSSAKASPSRATPEKVQSEFHTSHSNPRLLVRLPNAARSTAFSPTSNGGEDHSSVSDMKSKSNAAICPIENGPSNDNAKICELGKSDLIGAEKAKGPGPSKEGESTETTTFNPMNTLVESCENSLKVLIHCTKFPEGGVSCPSSTGDDIGMNLLAAVAAGEMSRAGNASPVCSAGGNAAPPDEISSGITSKSKELAVDDTQMSTEGNKESVPTGTPASIPNSELHPSNPAISPASPVSEPKQKMGHVLEIYEPSNPAAESPPPTGSATSGGPARSQEIKEAAEDFSSSSPKNESEKPKHKLLSPSNCNLPPQPPTPPFTRSFSGVDVKILSDALCSEGGCDRDAKSDGLELNPRNNSDEPDSSGSESHRDPVEDSSKRGLPDTSEEESSGSKEGEVPDLSNAPTSSSNPTSLLTSGSDAAAVKLEFDLNEGFSGEVDNQEEPGLEVLPSPGNQQVHHLPSFVTVAAAAKGPFFLPENPLKSRVELGWKGSAATSAFRPAEPRKPVDLFNDCPQPPTASPKPARCPLNIDLNVADETVLEDFFPQKSQVASSESAGQNCGSGGLDLDLNRTDDSLDGVNSCRNLSQFQGQRLFPGYSNGGDFMDSSRSFDLNNGPGPDEVLLEGPHHHHSMRNGSLLSFSLSPPVRINGSDFSTFSPWYPPGTSYSAITIPSILHGRGGEQGYPISGAAVAPVVHRVLGHPAGGNSAFTPDMYRGTVFSSSSSAIPFPSPSPALQYTGFPFETGSTAYGEAIPGGSGALCFPAIPSQIMGVLPVHFPRSPYMVGAPGTMGGGGTESRKWGGPILDLNCGPEVERRDDRLRQQTDCSPQGVTEEQMKMYQVGMKRKDPEGGWDSMERAFQKQQQQMSWR